QEMDKVKAEEAHEVEEIMTYFKEYTIVEVEETDLETIAVLTVALKNLADTYGCNAGTIQCWTALQDEIGILPYASISYLQEIGLPFSVETDIHGAITQLLAEARSEERRVGKECRLWRSTD